MVRLAHIFDYISHCDVRSCTPSTLYAVLIVAAVVISLRMTKRNEQKQPSANIIQMRAHANVMVFMMPA